MFHKEGHQIILISFFILITVSVASEFLIENLWVKNSIFGFLLIFFLLILQFFRNPKRSQKENENWIVSPVDGKVVVIEEVFENEFFNEKRLQISIFMSPINVHVTRHPVSGKVLYSKYHPGKYLVAWHPKSSQENERTTVVVHNNTFGSILYRQIAGALAKRIVNYAKVDQLVTQGSDSGFIKFGSRVDVFLPIGTSINVQLNQKVKGGISVLAQKNE